jgi:DNA invertase Pin-like site-specific DNA recombinase
MRVAIYVRVSTKGQELENQLLQLRDYAKNSNWTVTKEYSDVISGKEDKRPSYDQLFNDAHKKLFDVILFWDLSRFSRSGTLFTLQKLKELENLGIDWHSYQDRYLSSLGDFKDVVISIMATIAKIEREKISERTKAGLERTKAKGQKLGRKEIPISVLKEVEKYLKEGILSYRQISAKVTYKTKYGKVHHISPTQITRIRKSLFQKGGYENIQ